MPNHLQSVPPAIKKMSVSFVSSGKVVTHYPVIIRAPGDLFMGVKNAFEQLRKEHPTLNASGVEVSVKYETEERRPVRLRLARPSWVRSQAGSGNR